MANRMCKCVYDDSWHVNTITENLNIHDELISYLHLIEYETILIIFCGGLRSFDLYGSWSTVLTKSLVNKTTPKVNLACTWCLDHMSTWTNTDHSKWLKQVNLVLRCREQFIPVSHRKMLDSKYCHIAMQVPLRGNSFVVQLEPQYYIPDQPNFRPFQTATHNLNILKHNTVTH